MFMFTRISIGWEFRSVNHISIQKDSELKVLKRMNQMIYFEQTYTILLNLADNALLTIIQWTNSASVTSKWDSYLP